MKPTIVDELIKKISLLDSSKEYVELAVDLNDIYESSNKLDRLITDTLSSSLDQEKLIDQLIEIEVELDHINWHYKSFKKELKQLLNT
ncbi:hypothetical protein M3592_27225 [Priestia aryabhattai]|uniref:Uncharacterized protein n=1 Tax=Priestia megaterium Q3 TaxID=1452722 RepID=A0A806TYQ2_PRIMG|nr:MULTISPECIES: hypothetical protein [Priestia]AKP76776.1 hypothetical protein AS52_01811 [Priestia megaterium Q3]MCM2979097.1 hypothetical protein [Priestia aryabhattai]MED3923213.1 hypothetical protein [Priestia aryabhattai]MED3955811.1 hypothetical protein [Priestia aryabhattai]MED3988050.1 hypothetical protein [Priestia aryabhattai]